MTKFSVEYYEGQELITKEFDDVDEAAAFYDERHKQWFATEMKRKYEKLIGARG